MSADPMGHCLPLRHHHAALSVPDLPAARAWYGRVLGFALEFEVELPHIPARVATLRRGPLRIELFEVPGAQPASPDRGTPDLDVRTLGHKHVAFAVQDLDQALSFLQQQQVDLVFSHRAPFAAFAFVRDAFGNLIEFIEQPDLWSEGQEEEPAPAVKRVTAVEEGRT